jgi:hypothetical protein
VPSEINFASADTPEEANAAMTKSPDWAAEPIPPDSPELIVIVVFPDVLPTFVATAVPTNSIDFLVGSIPIVRGIPNRGAWFQNSRFSRLTMAGFGSTSFGFSGTMRPEASMAAIAGFKIML